MKKHKKIGTELWNSIVESLERYSNYPTIQRHKSIVKLVIKAQKHKKNIVLVFN